MTPILGIDIGGTGIKGAVVDTDIGELTAERFRTRTPASAKPDPIAETVAEIARHFDWHGPLGCGFPAVVREGVIYTAANIDESWIGINAAGLFQEKTGLPVTVINDADAAGLAEMRFGAGKGRQGVVLVLTIGTGIGSAVFINGQLVPNTEFGHLIIRDKDAERRASDATRRAKDLSWKAWARRLDEYLLYMERLFWPDLIILGGGVSKQHARFFKHLTVKSEIVPAQLLNLAGIIGAALSARQLHPFEAIA